MFKPATQFDVASNCAHRIFVKCQKIRYFAIEILYEKSMLFVFEILFECILHSTASQPSLFVCLFVSRITEEEKTTRAVYTQIRDRWHVGHGKYGGNLQNVMSGLG